MISKKSFPNTSGSKKVLNQVFSSKVKFIVISSFFVKLFFLLWSSHPYDFYSFVNTIQRSILYDWNVFESWNKGNLLIVLWYPLYSLYLFLANLFSTNNLLLLHGLFKFPFLVLDYVSAFILFDIIKSVSKDDKKAVKGMLFWILNPLVFYVYGIHGHYELLVPFSLGLIIWGIAKKRALVSALGLAVAFSTKYFVVIIIPFLLLFYLTNNRKLEAKKVFGFFVMILAILFVHLLIYPQFIQQTITSVVHLSQANAPAYLEEIKVQPLNLFSALTILIGDKPLTNLSNPWFYWVANWGVLISGAAILSLFFVRLKQVIFNYKVYYFSVLISDITVSLLLFALFLANFQAHYLCWFLPLLILLIFLNDKKSILLYSLIIYTVMGFIYLFRGEYGTKTFFMDILINPSLNFLQSKTSLGGYYGAAILSFVLLVTAGLILFSNTIKKTNSADSALYFVAVALLWMMLSFQFSSAIVQYLEAQNAPVELAFARDPNNKVFLFGSYPLESIHEDTFYFSDTDEKNRLIIPELVKMSSSNFSNYRTVISSDKPLIGSKGINDCGSLVEISKEPFVIQSGRYYYGVDLNCLKSSRNYLKAQSATNISSINVRLEIIRPDSTIPKSISFRLGLFALLGAVYILGSIFILILLFKLSSLNGGSKKL